MTNRTVFNELMNIAGWQGEFEDSVKITGGDPVLPTRFRTGEMAAGFHAACGAAVSKIWELQTGRQQTVEVDVRAAAASLRSSSYLVVPATVKGAGRGHMPMMDFFKTRDNRWIFLHAARDHFHVNALKILQCEPTSESIAAAISQWDAPVLEEALNAGGSMAVIARSREEWAIHPQGRVLRELPVVEILKIADSPPEPLGRGDRPLSGVKVFDITNVLSGPTCGRTLAEHGADVLRIDSQSDIRMKPLHFIIDTGHGKRSAFLDLRQESDYQKARSLIAGADVFSENYRYGAMMKLGFSPQELAKIRPGIICTSMNCYGYEGPWRGRPGMEQIGQTAAGLALEEGGTERPRTLPGAITDYTTGYLAAFGTLVALYRRAIEGGSYHVRTSLTQSAMLLGRQPRVAQTAEQVRGLEIPLDEVQKLSQTSDTPYGIITHLAPIVRLSETPARWVLPSVPLGTNPPEWVS